MIISEKSDCISINRAAELLDASRAGYYKWRDKSHDTEGEKILILPSKKKCKNSNRVPWIWLQKGQSGASQQKPCS